MHVVIVDLIFRRTLSKTYILLNIILCTRQSNPSTSSEKLTEEQPKT